MPNDVAYLFMCLLAVCNLWRTIYSDLLPGFLVELFLFLLLNCKSSYVQTRLACSGWYGHRLYVMLASCLSNIWFSHLFSHSVACFFTFLMASFAAPKFLILMKSQLPTFSLITCSFDAISKNCSPPGSSVNGILQSRILGWVDVPFSGGSSWPRDRTPGLLHCRQTLSCVSHQGSPRNLYLNPSCEDFCSCVFF